MKLCLIGQTLYLISLTLLKCSVLCFYMRVFACTGKLRLLTQCLLGCMVCWGAAFTLYFLLICRPLRAAWTPALAATRCGDQILMYCLLITSNMATDLVIMGLPLYTIWNLQMKVLERVALLTCFMLGLG